MSERLTKNNGSYKDGKPKQYSYKEYNDESFYSSFSDAIDKLGKIEDVLYDADGNEIVSLARLRELVEAERDGRIEIKEKDYKHNARVCSNCQSIVRYDPYFKRYLCRVCGQESYLPQAAKEMMEAARALTSSANQVDRCMTCDNNGKPICSSCIMTGHGNDIDFYRSAGEGAE